LLLVHKAGAVLDYTACLVQLVGRGGLAVPRRVAGFGAVGEVQEATMVITLGLELACGEDYLSLLASVTYSGPGEQQTEPRTITLSARALHSDPCPLLHALDTGEAAALPTFLTLFATGVSEQVRLHSPAGSLHPLPALLLPLGLVPVPSISGHFLLAPGPLQWCGLQLCGQSSSQRAEVVLYAPDHARLALLVRLLRGGLPADTELRLSE
jgi:hypothetical protein